MHIKYYIAVHIWKDKWWLLRPSFISLLCIPDDLVDEEYMYLYNPGSFSADQEESKYFGLIYNVSILLSSHCRYYHLSSKHSLLYMIAFSSTPYMHIKYYIGVHIRKDKWWLSRPPVISLLCIPDDLVDDESLCSPGSFTALQQEQSKYFGLIYNVSISLSSHCRYYHLSSKHSLLYMIAFSSTPICISNITLLFTFEKTNGDYWDHLLSHCYASQMT